MVALSIDFATEVRCPTVVESLSIGAFIEGATVDAMDMVRELSWPAPLEAILVVLVCEPGAPYPGKPDMLERSTWLLPEGARRLGITLPLTVW